MKTTTQRLKTAGRKLLQAFVLISCIGLFSNMASACSATFTYTTGANGLVNFTSSVTGFTSPIYWWNPGDGKGNMYTANPSHTYITNGTFNVTLYVTDSTCMDTITLPVTVTNVTNPCLISPSFTTSFGSHGAVTFTSTSTGTNINTVYFWDPGDGSGRVSGGTVFNHTYTYKGSYTVWLTLQDTTNLICIDSVPAYITVTNADSNSYGCTLSTNFTYTIGANGNVSFTSTSTGVTSANTTMWNPGDGSGASSYGYYNASYNHTYIKNGTFNVELYITTDSTWCSDSITIPVTITNVDTLEPCTLSPSFNITYDSSGQVTFTSTSTGTYANTLYYWNPGDGSPTQLGSSVFTYTYPFIGNYTCTLILKDTGAGYCLDSVSNPLYVYNKDSLQASFIYTADSIASGTYYFTSTSLGTNANTYYKWNAGDGSPADSGLGMTTYTHTYYVNGPYSATLTIWYTILPKALTHKVISFNHFDESSYTLVINVNNVTGIANLQDESGNYTLYPNPSNGQFRVSITGLSQSQNAKIDVLNILGENVYSTTAEASGSSFNKDINMQNAPAGLYFVRITTQNGVYTTKLIIGR
jgi:PKD repeat protein